MKKLLYTFSINEGKQTFPDKELFMKQYKALGDGKYSITIQKRSKSRTILQNNYYWLILTIFADSSGFDDTTELHDAMRERFLPKRLDKKFPYVPSTTQLSTKEFTDYIDKIRRLAGDYGCYLPLPEDQYLFEN